MTTPVYLNPPTSPFHLGELKEEQHLHLFLSVPQKPASSAHHHATFFNTTATTTTTTQDQRVVTKLEESKPYDHKVNKFMIHEGSGDHQQASSSSSLQSAVDNHSVANGHNLSFSRKEDGDNYESASDNYNGSSVKWMSSKMRLMKKMMNSNSSPAVKFQYPMHDHHDETNSNFSKTNNTIRVCSDCNTTTTPLWRSGPRGPKSLCNACGIRQRKARRAMEAAAAAANGVAVATDTTSMKIKVHMNKEKKSRSSHVVQYKKQFKPSDHYNSPHHHQTQKKLCSFKEFALSLGKNAALQRVFPQDVEEAAILLMELSCGLVHI
ncbi:hypothetical protein REPUB_Repub03eG0039200 [Reevesia pubescens]